MNDYKQVLRNRAEQHKDAVEEALGNKAMDHLQVRNRAAYNRWVTAVASHTDTSATPARGWGRFFRKVINWRNRA